MSMPTVSTIAEVRRQVAVWRKEGGRIGFVPTMGNLHEGHLELIRRARREADHVVASIFVNPLQFTAGEDFDAYPRTLAQDQSKLAAEGTALLFTPPEAEMYPDGRAGVTQVEVPGLADMLCGAFRPGHFQGVATVVAKLFHIVLPDIAVFGEKDYQQLVVIQRMVRDLDFPVRILGVPTVREADGLAMSSRNAYLNAEERERATGIYRALSQAAGRLRAGEQDYAAIERAGVEQLAAEGFAPDYFSVRRADDLGPPTRGAGHLVVLAAARLGKARLIDNVLVAQ